MLCDGAEIGGILGMLFATHSTGADAVAGGVAVRAGVIKTTVRGAAAETAPQELLGAVLAIYPQHGDADGV